MDELVGMKRARLVKEVVQVRLHLVEVLVFPEILAGSDGHVPSSTHSSW